MANTVQIGNKTVGLPNIIMYNNNKYNNEQFCDLYFSPRIIRFFASRRMRWADHVAHLGEKCKLCFVGNPERKRTLRTRGPRRGAVILMSSNNDGKLNGFIWLRYKPWTDFL
jgi:hypothetical protein